MYNIILGKKTGTMFPIKVQDKEVNVLLDTGAEKSCMSTAILMKLNLVLSTTNKPRLHNASGRDMKTQGIVVVDFGLGNTNFKQEFVVCDDIVRPMILGCDFTVNQYIGDIWMRQGTKKITQDDYTATELEERASGKVLMTMRRIAIPPRHYAVFNLECNLQEGKFDIKPDPYLQQQEPNLWMDSFILYNTPCEDLDNTTKGDTEDFAEQAEITSPKKTEVKKSEYTSENLEDVNEKIDKVHIPFCIFNLSYENHSYIARDRVLAFAVREENEGTEVFKVEEVKTQQEYRNWIPNKKGNLPVPPKSDFICSPAEVSLPRKVKLKSKPVKEDSPEV